MQRSIPWFWIVLALALLLLPGPAGRIVLDLLGGLTLTILLLPLLAGAAGFIGWQLLRRRLRTCPSCGLASLGTDLCPACGHSFSGDDSEPAGPAGGWFSGGEVDIDASNVTINVDAVDVDNDHSGVDQR